MSTRKKVKIFLGVSFFLTAFTCGYIRLAWKNCVTEQEAEILIHRIKKAKPLPSNFTLVFEKMHPNYSNQGLWSWVFNNSNNITESPAALIVARNTIHCPGQRITKKLNSLSFAGKLEREIGNLQCQAFQLKNQTLNHRSTKRGIWNAAKELFNKPLDNLSQEECVEIILRTKALSHYDRKRNPEKVENAVQMWMKKIKED